MSQSKRNGLLDLQNHSMDDGSNTVLGWDASEGVNKRGEISLPNSKSSAQRLSVAVATTQSNGVYRAGSLSQWWCRKKKISLYKLAGLRWLFGLLLSFSDYGTYGVDQNHNFCNISTKPQSWKVWGAIFGLRLLMSSLRFWQSFRRKVTVVVEQSMS